MVSKKMNLDVALTHLGGSMSLFETLISGFYNQYSHVDEDIKKLLDAGKQEEARLLAHSIKGLSGNLGASELVGKAKALEISIEADLDTRTRDLKDFSIALKEVLEEILSLLEVVDTTSS
ncbi:Hpt domain-containing protein [Petrocella sp. FN5]|uniref:Hpt domain-containing protein n=1 Tax=Petrocella sp. FN5 TaxID=3032002 RepID=UPI0023DA9F04|nr:Hpt domain-containing protein [Petrocella sp. FN5]MDF1616486.1 Hpt domain-containing protein [Petrocella sp. FN5]